MAQFQGIEDFVAAITGGGGAIQGQEFSRLVKQRSEQSLLDKRIAEAAMAQTENTQFQDLGQFFDPRQTAVIQSGTGADLSALMTAEGTGQKNDLRGNLMTIIEGMVKSGAPQNDIFNAIASAISGTTLTAPELGAQAQSGANLDLTQQQIQKAIAGIGADNSLTIKRGAETSKIVGETGGGPNLESITGTDLGLLALEPDVVPVRTGSTSRIPFVGEDIIEDLPFDDPRAQKELAKLRENNPDALVQFLGPEFAQWRIARLPTDPQMIDSAYAIGKFLEERQAGGARVSGAGPAPASPTGSVAKFVRDANGNLVFLQ